MWEIKSINKKRGFVLIKFICIIVFVLLICRFSFLKVTNKTTFRVLIGVSIYITLLSYQKFKYDKQNLNFRIKEIKIHLKDYNNLTKKELACYENSFTLQVCSMCSKINLYKNTTLNHTCFSGNAAAYKLSNYDYTCKQCQIKNIQK